jgi:hypothetical protein
MASNSHFDLAIGVSKPSISNRKGARSAKRKVSNTTTPPKEEMSRKGRLKQELNQGSNWIEFLLPIETFSEANGGRKKCITLNGRKTYKKEHWSDANARHRKQKGYVFLCIKPHRHLLKLPCHVTLTRYASSKLDRADNLPMSMKWIYDAVCAVITGDYRPGRADDSEEINVTYKQVICDEMWVRIRIEML